MFWKCIGLFMSFGHLKPMSLFRFSRSYRVFGRKGHGFLKTYGYCAKFLFSGTFISYVFCWSATYRRQILMGKIYLIYTLMVKIDLDDIYILYSLGWNDIFSIICGVFLWFVQIWMMKIQVLSDISYNMQFLWSFSTVSYMIWFLFISGWIWVEKFIQHCFIESNLWVEFLP